MFTPAELLDLIVGDRPWEPLDTPRLSVSDATAATSQPFERAAEDVRAHVAAHGEIRFHELTWSQYPHIVLAHDDGYAWTSVQLALRKR
jgi:hypothetical protein